MAGLSLGLSYSPKKYFKIVGEIPKEWQKMKRRYLQDCIKEFYNDKLIDFREGADGICRTVLTEKGKKKILSFEFDRVAIRKPKLWDGKWRIVIFDIPESKKAVRDALRRKFKSLGFYQWQKSVFIHPFDCLDEIEFLIEFFQIRPYVRFFEASRIMNESELLLYFENVVNF